MVAKHRPLEFKSTNIADEENRVLQQQRIQEDLHCHEDQKVTDVAAENSFGHSDVVEKNLVVSSCNCCKDDRPTDLSVIRCSQRLQDAIISHQETSCSCQSSSHPTEANSKSKSDSATFSNFSSLTENLAKRIDNLDGVKHQGATAEPGKIDTEHNPQTLTGDYHDRIQGKIKSVDQQQVVTGREGTDPRESQQRPVRDYLENLSVEEEERFLLQDKLLMRFARIIDVVTSQDCNTRCFTKALVCFLFLTVLDYSS